MCAHRGGVDPRRRATSRRNGRGAITATVAAAIASTAHFRAAPPRGLSPPPAAAPPPTTTFSPPRSQCHRRRSRRSFPPQPRRQGGARAAVAQHWQQQRRGRLVPISLPAPATSACPIPAAGLCRQCAAPEPTPAHRERHGSYEGVGWGAEANASPVASSLRQARPIVYVEMYE